MGGRDVPNEIRGSGLAVAGFARWIANFAISVSFPALAVSLALAPTYAFDALNAPVWLVFVRGMVHETRGKEPEPMEGWRRL